MECQLTTTDRLTHTCQTCGRVVAFKTPRALGSVHLPNCGTRTVQPQQPLARPGKTTTALERLLTTIREMPDLPPWPAVERHAKHVVETGAWSGCEKGRADWARRVVELASKPGLWHAEWGEYPNQLAASREPSSEHRST